MPTPLSTILKTGNLTQMRLFPDLSEGAVGLPMVTGEPCAGSSCGECVRACPTRAIQIVEDVVSLDRGRCIGCGQCMEKCPTGTISRDRSTMTAVRSREELVLTNGSAPAVEVEARPPFFRRSLHVREVSTGDSGTDQEVIAATNSIFDVARFGVHFVASPRFADALLVTGPVGKAMQDALRRCYDAMAEPRLVIAVGTSAISGGLFEGGYAAADGADGILPVDCYVPGDPPHPWSIIHGLLVAMGRVDQCSNPIRVNSTVQRITPVPPYGPGATNPESGLP